MDINKENHSLFLEQSILGIILSNNNYLHQISEMKPEYFSNDVNQRIFTYIYDRFERGKGTDLILISDFLKKEQIPIDYIKQLQNNYNHGNIEQYANLLYNLYLKKESLKIANSIQEESNNYHENYEEYLSGLENKIIKLLSTQGEKKSLSLFNCMQVTMTNYSKNNQRLKTSNFFLDKTTGGFGLGELTILAARPSVGKTALSVNLAVNMAKNNIPVLFLSLEMPQEQICMRILASETGIPMNFFIHQQLSSEMLITCSQEIDTLQDTPLFINDNPTCTLRYLKNLLRVNIKQHGIQVVFIDYLQLILADKNQSREQEIANISRTLKILSKELNIAVVCLSQMSRKIENRNVDKKQPMLSDLRDSGSIEQDADIVMFLYRKNAENRNQVTLTIEKNRNGPLGSQDFTFQGTTLSFIPQFQQNVVQI